MKDNIILSIHPNYADLIDEGKKIYEVRTRCLNLDVGTRIWIYKTSPKSSISSYAEIEKIICISPDKAWKKYSREMFIKKVDYDNYVKNKKEIYLLKLRHITKLSKEIKLSDLKKKNIEFYPPQFFKKLKDTEVIYRTLNKLL